ncbi:aldehyde dehydrogenase family 3 member B1-like isoform X1 [Athalia rosae]|uniref:aldehyde dehydrogenase family 3 member B1-like isoform X1 n=1 Tax=Athalia rosae TaxID=37344 RepID=UPI002034A0DC|nr:aldehyde dehydrogenase family 3 member B1-like isoform X1 [Athalia rosae]
MSIKHHLSHPIGASNVIRSSSTAYVERSRDAVKISVESSLSDRDRSRQNHNDGNLTTSNYGDLIQRLRATFYTGKTRPLEWRKTQLKALLKMIDENLPELHAALTADLGRCKNENNILEFTFINNATSEMLAHLAEWSAPEMAPRSLATMFDSLKIFNDPYGVVLVMGTWNFPLQLSLIPMMGALAAGNCVVLKPSEVAQATAKVIAQLVPKYIDNECCKVLLGGIPETTELLKQRFDYIFYTGSTPVGKIIREASNKFLTPVTLELGGKSPVYIDSSADISITARRVLWGKMLNAGQTCIAPDYILCTIEVQELILNEIRKVIKEWYGDDPKISPYIARIITDRHFQRLVGFLSGNGEIAIGGESDASERYIAPTVLINVKPTDPVMCDEIFGPILPVVTISNVYKAVEFINSREKPLAFYIFSKIKDDVDFILENTSSGGVCVNEAVLQVAVETLPFGGVGASGMGSYHGKYTFDAFVHKKSAIIKSFNGMIEAVGSVRYPPNTDLKTRLLLMSLRGLPEIPGSKYLPYVLVFVLGFFSSIGFQEALKNYANGED